MFHFDLSGVEISERSGISPAQISNFRHGKNLRIDTLERILNALPQEAKVYMLNLVAQAESSPPSFVRDYEADPKNEADG